MPGNLQNRYTLALAILLGASVASHAGDPSPKELEALANSTDLKKKDIAFWNSPPVDEARFMTLPDGTRLALSLYYPKGLDRAAGKAPTIFIDSIYGRAEEASVAAIDLYRDAGFVVVIGDARGFGASFGSSAGFNTAQQTEDEAEVVKWISEQSWSDGNVAAAGHSVSAVFADSMTASGAPALKAAIVRAEDFDEYSLNVFPGGAPNIRILELAAELMEWHAGAACIEKLAACGELGFPPVDEDKDLKLLQAAMRDHHGNLKSEGFGNIVYSDDRLGSGTLVAFSPIGRIEKIRSEAIPARVTASWMDGATAQGAVERFLQAKNAPMEIVIGATTHPGGLDADPFAIEPFALARPSATEQYSGDVAFLKRVLSGEKIGRSIRYVVLGTDTWKTTEQWPPAGVRYVTLALAPSALTSDAVEAGQVPYQVDPDVTSGPFNRWGAQRGRPIYYGDRRAAQGKRLEFDGPAFTEDMELVGSPELCLVLSTDQNDGLITAHLQDVAPDGRATYLTEGILRLLHRKTEGEACDPASGTKRGYARKDGAPVVAGEPMNIELSLLPVAALIKAGHHLRLSLAGADAGFFPTLTDDKRANWNVALGGANGSRLAVPLKSWTTP